MRSDVSVLFNTHSIPATRRAHIQRAVLGATAAPAGRPAAARRSPRLGLAIGLAAVLVAAAGTALAIGTDFLAQQDEIDKAPWTPPEMRATGPRAIVARGPDWAFMVWRSAADGLCVAYAAGTPDSWARSCGRSPTSAGAVPEESKYLVTLLARAGHASVALDRKSAIIGAVRPPVVEVELELADGRVLSAPTVDAPGMIDAQVRFFIVRAQIDAKRPGQLVRAVVMYADGREPLERFVMG